MAIINGWIDWAVRVDGHPQKVYSQPNSGEWITCHSIVGNLPNHAIPARFLADDRVPGNPSRFTDAVAASVMFILYKDGQLTQMYPVTASTWTSGGFDGNTRSWAVEAEGGYNPVTEKLTPEASATFVRLVREWEAYTGRKAVPNETLLQHKQVAQQFGYALTACASDRYSEAWDMVLQNSEDDMYKEKYEELTVAIDKRMAILALASDLNRYEEVLKAYDLLKANGLL